MAAEPKEADIPQESDNQKEVRPVATGLIGTIQDSYRRTKEHAETYPYVWASYLTVYGGFGLWLLYRWRRLRGTEDRVRALQERLRVVFEEQQSRNSAEVTNQSINSTSLKNNIHSASQVKKPDEQHSSNSAEVSEISSDSDSLKNKLPASDKASDKAA